MSIRFNSFIVTLITVMAVTVCAVEIGSFVKALGLLFFVEVGGLFFPKWLFSMKEF